MALQHPFISGAATKHALPDKSEAQQQKKQKKKTDGWTRA